MTDAVQLRLFAPPPEAPRVVLELAPRRAGARSGWERWLASVWDVYLGRTRLGWIGTDDPDHGWHAECSERAMAGMGGPITRQAAAEWLYRHWQACHALAGANDAPENALQPSPDAPESKSDGETDSGAIAAWVRA